MKKTDPKRIGEHHSFSVNVACQVGDRKAIILKELYGWCLHNFQNNRNVFFGIPWTYNSAKAYSEKFKYWPEKSIARWIKELESEKWICSTDKFNKFRIDRTKWYAIDFERYDAAVLGEQTSISHNENWYSYIKESISHYEESMYQNDTSESPKMRDDISQNEEPIPSNTISNTSKTSSRKRAREKTEQEAGKVTTLKAKKNDSPQVAARPPHENDFPQSDEELTILTDFPTPEQCASAMYEYYNGPGSETWKTFEMGAGMKPGESVDKYQICLGWAFKYSDEPYTLREWRNKSRKNLITWIRNDLNTQRRNTTPTGNKKQVAALQKIDGSKFDKYRQSASSSGLVKIKG